MKQVLIANYGLGNVKSVLRAFEHIGVSCNLSKNPKEICDADYLVLPGVGAFKNGMEGLASAGFIDSIFELVLKERPLLGICLGMQMLFESSEEFGQQKGLGVFEGHVAPIPHVVDGVLIRKVPHIGWNKLTLPTSRCGWDESCMADLNIGETVYFVHSFMARPKHQEDLLAECDYEGVRIAAGVQKDNIVGLQFHPEKSGLNGLKILKGFINS